MGVQKRENVAVWATNIPHWVDLQFATAEIAAVLLTVNTNHKTAELANLLEPSDTETLFLIDGYQDTDDIRSVYELVPELKEQERGNLECEVMLSHYNTGNNDWWTGEHQHLTEKDRFCLPVPLFHCCGLHPGSGSRLMP